MTRRMRGTVSFSYTVEDSEYTACKSIHDMADVDQDLMTEEYAHILHFLDRSDALDISVVPALSLVRPDE